MSADENKPTFIFYFYFLILVYQLKYIGLTQEFGVFCAQIVVLLIQIFYTKENTKQLTRPSLFVFAFLIQFSFPLFLALETCRYFKNPANNVHIYISIKSSRQNPK